MHTLSKEHIDASALRQAECLMGIDGANDTRVAIPAFSWLAGSNVYGLKLSLNVRGPTNEG